MTDFNSALAATTIDLAADHETTADAGADRHVEDRRIPLSRSKSCLGQSGAVGVVSKHGRHAERFLGPFRKRKFFPPGNLVRFQHSASRIVYWPAKTDADATKLRAIELRRRQQIGHSSNDLPANSFGTGWDIDGISAEGDERPVARPDSELQLRATDFDAKEHAVLKGVSDQCERGKNQSVAIGGRLQRPRPPLITHPPRHIADHPVKRSQVNGLDHAHVVERHVKILVSE